MAWPLIFFIAGLMAVSIGCLLPAHWCPPLPNDKFLHFVAFGGLALLAGLMTRNRNELLGAHAALFGISWLIEILQTWVPGRQFCWRDLLANLAGILSAFIVLMIFNPVARIVLQN